MSATISLMYKRSGGCSVGKTCGECKHFIHSKEIPKSFICEKHGEEHTFWKATWTACKYIDGEPIIQPKKKRKLGTKSRKPRTKKPKLKEEETGQFSLVLL